MVYMFTFNDSNIPADSFCNTVLDDDCAKEMPLHTMKQPAHHFNMNVITLCINTHLSDVRTVTVLTV